MFTHRIVFIFIMLIFVHSTHALKMVPAEQVCEQKGLEPGTAEYTACLEQEQARQAALIKTIMVKEESPTPPAEELTAPTVIPETEPVQPPVESTSETDIVTVAQPEEHQPATPAVPATEITPTQPSTLSVIIAQQAAAEKTNPQPLTASAPTPASSLTHQEFTEVDGCMATVDVNEHGELIPEPTRTPDCAPSACDLNRL